MPPSFPRLAASVAAVVLAMSTAAAQAQAQAQARSFDVPAQPASSGVRTFAQQAGIQIVVSLDDADGRTTHAVQGELDVQAALDRLIAGTGLFVRSEEGGIVVLGAPPPTGATGATTTSTLDAIVVTGSRMARPELESAMPVSVIDMERAQRQGKTTLYETLLQDITVGPGNGPYQSAPEGQYDAGQANIDLRNMGVARSLTLIDGKRRVGSGASSSAIDVNMIPSGMVERIEIVTGGAAAVYGADAVTGVANIITRKDYDGLELTGTTGTTQEGGGGKSQVSILAGTHFDDDRGSIVIGGTWARNDPIHFYDRYSKDTNLSYQVNPANTGPDDGIADRIVYHHTTNMYLQPVPNIWVGGDTYLLNPDGSAYVGQYDTCFSGCGTSRDGGDGGMPQSQYWSDFLIAPIENASFVGKFDYRLADGVNYGLRFDYGRSRYDAYRRPYRDDDRLTWLNGAGGAMAYLDNPYLPDSFRQVMQANGLTSTPLRRSYENFGQMTDRSDRQLLSIGNSLGGSFAQGRFDWEAFWQYSKSENDITATNTPIASHFVYARDVIAENGVPVCRDEAARAAGCVPFNIFSTEPLTAQQRDYLLSNRYKHREQSQNLFGANVAGELFTLPAGAMQGVLGFEGRKETIDNVDDNNARPFPAGDPNHPLFPQGGSELGHLGAWAPYEPELHAEREVKELFAELVVPVLKDVAFARHLAVEGAYRYSDYSDFDATHTWKLGTTWSPVQGLTLRAVKSRSVRVPNFGEMYSSRARQEIGVRDQCMANAYNANPTRQANCEKLLGALGFASPLPNVIGTGYVISGGNPDLVPETSDSTTFGLVWQPRFVQGLDLTLDYWDIKLDKMIVALSQGNILALCVDLPSIDNEFCGRISRDALGYAEGVDTSYMNVSSSEAEGIDLGANYGFDLGPGRLGLGLRASYLIGYETTTLPGIDSSVVVYDGGYQNPHFRANLDTSYDIGNWDIGLNTRYWGKALNYTNVSDEAYDRNRLPPRIYNDLTVGWHMRDRDVTFRVGINNLFDVQPPYLPRTYYQGGGGVYDVYGRYYFANVKVAF